MQQLSLLWAYLKIAARVLRANKLRSLLTVISITIGAFSIVLMTSLADGGLQTIAKDIEDLGGARLLLITPDEPVRMKDKAGLAPGYLTKDDQEALLRSLPHLAEKTFYAGLDEKEVITDFGKSAMIDVIAADTGFLPAFRMVIEKGRAFTDDEDHSRASVCVVGPGLAEELFEGDAVGKRVSVMGTRCLIVGQTAKLARMGMNFGFSWERFIVMPLQTLRDVDRSSTTWTILVAKSDAVEHNDIIKRVANAVMSHRHHGVDDFEVWDFSSVMKQFEQVFLILKLIVGFVASISLLVGGVGVMNMMFVSVSERTREIGIRKAIGASPRAIEAQFLFEAMFLSSIGGVLGVGLGIAGVVGANLFIHSVQPAWSGTISMPAVIISMLVSLGVGVGFGFVPAKRAAALDAVVAMRR
ncbi:MAG: ABC transporter permease [Deltaproteobacteria bacterium]|nr:ABC transporter permease [Deltaproteobacteria bacterium]